MPALARIPGSSLLWLQYPSLNLVILQINSLEDPWIACLLQGGLAPKPADPIPTKHADWPLYLKPLHCYISDIIGWLEWMSVIFYLPFSPPQWIQTCSSPIMKEIRSTLNIILVWIRRVSFALSYRNGATPLKVIPNYIDQNVKENKHMKSKALTRMSENLDSGPCDSSCFCIHALCTWQRWADGQAYLMIWFITIGSGGSSKLVSLWGISENFSRGQSKIWNTMKPVTLQNPICC